MTAPQENQSRNVATRVRSVLISVALIYLGLMAMAYSFQDELLFAPTEEVLVSSELVNWNFENVELSVGEESTHGWFIPAASESRGTILFSHGNAGNIGDRIETIRTFRLLGFATFIYDYGGYGRSTGGITEERCYEDIRAAWTYLTETRGIAPDTIVLFGRSLGGGPTAQLATEVTPMAVVLESTFTSIADMAAKQFPIFPVKLLIKHQFANIDKVADISAPILHIHSRDDTLIPYEHGEQLFEASTVPKSFLEISGDHNEGYWLSGETYLQGLRTFFQRLGSQETEDA
jgi:uncharacterized protein